MSGSFYPGKLGMEPAIQLWDSDILGAPHCPSAYSFLSINLICHHVELVYTSTSPLQQQLAIMKPHTPHLSGIWSENSLARTSHRPEVPGEEH